MANKPAPRNWNDIQIAIATISMAITLVFWNMFAGPDRETAAKRAQEQAAIPPRTDSYSRSNQLQLRQLHWADGKILFGGSAPQTQIIVQDWWRRRRWRRWRWWRWGWWRWRR